eukprot:TRINITY_DN22333_c0_g1_i1.p1 TRINITY_DN22333_c0_g1~~TRINITY_DN22333_c0_g1_i1.p1  ORF type:complete len:498 (+),score=98.58 TRINITY_DN22333_c0_g1_i1:83-1576(+)
MGTGRRYGDCEADDAPLKPRMVLAEKSKAVVRFASTKATMKHATTGELTQLRARALDLEMQLRCGKQDLTRTQERLAATTRALGEKRAEAERADRERGHLAELLELSRQELATATCALREKDGTIQGMQIRAAEAERAREQSAERLKRSLQELAAAAGLLQEKDAEADGLLSREQAVVSVQRFHQELVAARSALREKDAALEQLRADSQGEAAHVRAQLVAACREASATAQRARVLEQRVRELETPAVVTCGSPEHRPRPPGGPAESPEAMRSSRGGSTETCSATGSLSSAPTSVGTSDTRDAAPARAEQVSPRSDKEAGPAALVAKHAQHSNASEAIFIDQICFWISTFVHRDWARVCSRSARMVAHVMFVFKEGWVSVVDLLGHWQSQGAPCRFDRLNFGPEPGPLMAAAGDMDRLRHKARSLQLNSGNAFWFNRWYVYMGMTVNLYDEMQLRSKEIFLTARQTCILLAHTVDSLNAALEMYDSRKAAEEQLSGD